MWDWISRGDFGTAPDDMSGMALGILMSFLCGHVVAWVYMACHTGLSYSRSFVTSLVALCLVVAVVMLVMANNVFVALGLMAVFAVVRFRNMLRDTLDTTYILATICLGMACGTRKFGTAVVGAAAFAVLMLYLRWSHFGARHRYDLILNLHWSRPPGDLPDLSTFLERHARDAKLASRRGDAGGGGVDLSFRLLLRDPGRSQLLLEELAAFPGASRITGIQAEDESEM
jgi:Domain of unknown function (DUF4956)